jgi:hypothetical protein
MVDYFSEDDDVITDTFPNLKKYYKINELRINKNNKKKIEEFDDTGDDSENEEVDDEAIFPETPIIEKGIFQVTG